MKAPSLIIILFLLCMTIVLVALDLLSMHNQRTNSQVMERVIADLTERSRRLESELTQLREQPTSQPAVEPAPAAAIQTDPATGGTGSNSSAAKPALPQPFQARAYVGKDYLGMAWVVPSNIREHAETGEYRFEPVIWIDEKARKMFTQTNVVEREIVRNTTYNQVYEQPYWYGYPVWVNPKPHHPVAPPPQRPPVVQPSPGRPSSPWAPVGGGSQTKVPAGR